MIVITAQGRLSQQPELKLLPGGDSVCEFRLLSSRFSKGKELTEAVTFVCFDEEAERFCESTEKGQLISATGTQETNSYTDASGQTRTFVKYRLTWFEKGPRPRRDRPGGDEAPARPPVPCTTASRNQQAQALNRSPYQPRNTTAQVATALRSTKDVSHQDDDDNAFDDVTKFI